MFDNVVYLNRDIDIARKEKTESQLTKYGIEATRFSAITENLQEFVGHPLNDLRINLAQISCLVSHLEIIRTYGLDLPLVVFEDDIDLSTVDYWDFTFEQLLAEIPEAVGIVQLFYFPASKQATAVPWIAGYFGTAAYFIRPWYAKQLVANWYSDGKWNIKGMPSRYVQPLADSVLYTPGPSLSLSLFSTRKEVSTILPHATYTDSAEKALEEWRSSPIPFSDILISIDKYKKVTKIYE